MFADNFPELESLNDLQLQTIISSSCLSRQRVREIIEENFIGDLRLQLLNKFKLEE